MIEQMAKRTQSEKCSDFNATPRQAGSRQDARGATAIWQNEPKTKSAAIST
jgi:hypothetical protein